MCRWIFSGDAPVMCGSYFASQRDPRHPQRPPPQLHLNKHAPSPHTRLGRSPLCQRTHRKKRKNDQMQSRGDCRKRRDAHSSGNIRPRPYGLRLLRCAVGCRLATRSSTPQATSRHAIHSCCLPALLTRRGVFVDCQTRVCQASDESC